MSSKKQLKPGTGLDQQRQAAGLELWAVVPLLHCVAPLFLHVGLVSLRSQGNLKWRLRLRRETHPLMGTPGVLR